MSAVQQPRGEAIAAQMLDPAGAITQLGSFQTLMVGRVEALAPAADRQNRRDQSEHRPARIEPQI
jgi:hypothetical protein